MFSPGTVPFGAKLLFNTVKLEPGVSFDDVEAAVAQMCKVVQQTCGGDSLVPSAPPTRRWAR